MLSGNGRREPDCPLCGAKFPVRERLHEHWANMTFGEFREHAVAVAIEKSFGMSFRETLLEEIRRASDMQLIEIPDTVMRHAEVLEGLL